MENLNKEPLEPGLPSGDLGIKTVKHVLKSLQARADLKRTKPEKIADWMTGIFGSAAFLAVNMLWFATWVIAGNGLISSIPAFDPYPFHFLTMTVSLEAIILSIFVLISQNRSRKVDELRAEADLQLDIITEHEVTKILKLIKLLAEKNGIDLSHDKVLQDMMRPVDVNKIESMLERQMID
ncbi:MAG: DUF1003 domain-containing protein [bacterium]|nr:DUF1003 domain-containing protein [bacterium]